MSENFSAEVGELAKALACAQGMMANAKKTCDNPFFKSKYADLATVWDACREPLTKNGLSVVQMPGAIDEKGNIEITTMLVHSSSQWIRSTMRIKVTKADAQGIGSAITYGRRYALAAMVGIAQEDDDGEGAVGRNAKVKKDDEGEKQVLLHRLIDEAKKKNCLNKMGTIIKAKFGKGSSGELSVGEVQYLINNLDKLATQDKQGEGKR